MGETKITDFFSPRTPARKPSRPGASASAGGVGRTGSQGGASENHQQNARLSNTKPSSQQLAPHSVSQPGATPSQGNLNSAYPAASVSIPSTPPSPVVTSRSTAPKRRRPLPGDRIPETPKPSRRNGPSHIRSLRTPDKPLPLALGSSPFTPIDISSADESSDSDCRVQRVVRTPSRKHKESDSTPSKTQLKGLRTDGPASAPRPKVQPRPKSPASRSARVAATRATSLPPVSFSSAQRSASIPRHPATPTTRKSPCIAKFARPKNAQSRVASSAQFVDGAEDSDCIIVKTQKSPMKRRQSNSGNVPAKKRRIAMDLPVPVINSQASNGGGGSDCEILDVIEKPTKPTPSHKAVHPSSSVQDRDAGSDQVSVPRSATVALSEKIASCSSAIAGSPRTPTITGLLKSPSLSQAKESPMIDLTQDSSSDSDDWDRFEDALETQSRDRLP
ncbi:hypothetical protein B0T10DRAFT_230748 [Thelonectria olida]|uniref:Uncharacterized protein n=1 Tax=Thelonectria olida TaxID=1576542 RepID=A0A9P8WCJ0_9HYPO|nr:hypothetical protein B0T10DRAFT_230748 [Thelonectria olida]